MPVPPNLPEGPCLHEAPWDVSLGVGEGAGLVSFCLGRMCEWDVSDHSAPALQGRGKEGAIGCSGLPVLDGSRGVEG